MARMGRQAGERRHKWMPFLAMSLSLSLFAPARATRQHPKASGSTKPGEGQFHTIKADSNPMSRKSAAAAGRHAHLLHFGLVVDWKDPGVLKVNSSQYKEFVRLLHKDIDHALHTDPQTMHCRHALRLREMKQWHKAQKHTDGHVEVYALLELQMLGHVTPSMALDTLNTQTQDEKSALMNGELTKTLNLELRLWGELEGAICKPDHEFEGQVGECCPKKKYHKPCEKCPKGQAPNRVSDMNELGCVVGRSCECLQRPRARLQHRPSFKKSKIAPSYGQMFGPSVNSEVFAMGGPLLVVFVLLVCARPTASCKRGRGERRREARGQYLPGYEAN